MDDRGDSFNRLEAQRRSCCGNAPNIHCGGAREATGDDGRQPTKVRVEEVGAAISVKEGEARQYAVATAFLAHVSSSLKA